jgi:Tol biopolymer transport system component
MFIFDTTAGFTQVTTTTGGANDEPSINADGTRIAFRSDRDITGGNADNNFEIFLASIVLEASDVLNFFDDKVGTGDLQGIGSGNSADGKLNALRNKIIESDDLIDAGDIAGACDVLEGAYKHCDGQPRPKDFVSGDAASELAEMIQDLMLNIGCF